MNEFYTPSFLDPASLWLISARNKGAIRHSLHGYKVDVGGVGVYNMSDPRWPTWIAPCSNSMSIIICIPTHTSFGSKCTTADLGSNIYTY